MHELQNHLTSESISGAGWSTSRPYARHSCKPLFHQLQSALWLLAFVVSLLNRSHASDPPNPASEVAGQIDSLHEIIAEELTTLLRTNSVKGSYTTVWRQFEDQAIDALKLILPRHVPSLTANQFDAGQTGREKNRLADLALAIGSQTIEISIKAARASSNPENDMGTFRDYPHRKKLFAASFTLWVRYSDSPTNTIRCDRVFFDRTRNFVGRSSLLNGVKYRKKDGNMRPKPWAMFDSGDSFWKSDAEFESAVKRSELFRANELIKEYLEDLSESDQRLLFEHLKPQFAPQLK